MPSETKKRRLLEASPAEQFAALRKLSCLTPATCRAVISTLRDDGAGKRVCHRQKNFHAQSYPVRGVEDDTFVTLPCMSLPALIEAKVQACALYKAMLHEACRAHNGELTLLFYTDEVTGGNVLSAPQARKANLIYVSWLECPLLHMESQWLTLSVCRSTDISDMRGGMAALVTAVLTFIKRECSNGFPIAWSEKDVDLIRIKKIYIVADAEALRSLSGCKGHAGLKCCLQQDCEKYLGWNWENFQQGPLLVPELSDWITMDGLLFDSMHIFFNNGQICQLLGQWYAMLLKHTTFSLSHLGTYAALWTPVKGSPASCGPKPAKYFSSKLWRSDADYRGMRMLLRLRCASSLLFAKKY
eukprot:s240_g32.t1